MKYFLKKKILKVSMKMILTIMLPLPLIAIGVIYKVSKINFFNNPDFWYGYMAYFGTVSLAIISICQNQKAYNISDRMLKIEEQRNLPYVDIIREKSTVAEINDKIIKIKLWLTNYSEYPVHNIYLSKTKLNIKDLDKLYNRNEIENEIFSQLSKLPPNKESENYILTTISGLREISITHRKNNTDEIESLPNSESLYFNVNIEEVSKPITLFIYMQNIYHDVFEQETKLFIIKKKENDYFLTMHSKSVSLIIGNE